MSGKGPGFGQRLALSRKASVGAKNAKVGRLDPIQRQQVTTERPREDDELRGKGPIAMLQEFVQSSKAFQLPPNYSALQWGYETRMASKATLQYRATVAFYLEGVPHHAAGTWHASKKRAQRDAADRALRLFVGRWGEELLRFQPDEESESCFECPGDSEGTSEYIDEEQLLESFCEQLPVCAGSGPLKWNLEQKNGSGQEDCQCFAIVEVNLLGVPHKLAGAPKDTEKEARADAARRALWYLQCPGFEAAFEPERLACSKQLPDEIAVPPEDWLHDDSSQEAIAEANRKTVVMRAQNRLQQAFAGQLQSRVGVWEWTYQTDPDDAEWPPLFQATVQVPVLGRTFVGDWARGQRDAQIETIACVNAFLDETVGDRHH